MCRARRLNPPENSKDRRPSQAPQVPLARRAGCASFSIPWPDRTLIKRYEQVEASPAAMLPPEQLLPVNID